MLIATSAVLHRVFTFNTTLSTTLGVGAWITSTIMLFSLWHCMTDEITMHSVLFGIMIALVGIKTRMIISERVKDSEVRREVRKLCSWGGGESFPVMHGREFS
jgi:dihydroceramidase